VAVAAALSVIGKTLIGSRPVVRAWIRPCYDAVVKYRLAISRLLTLLALVGLVLGPLARPAMSMSSPQAAVMDDHATGTVMNGQAMAEMPCCPDEAPKSDCAKDCPLMALCTATGIQFFAAAPALNLPTMHSVQFRPDRAAELRGLAERPPPKPPKA
jgi:hypothetical protein